MTDCIRRANSVWTTCPCPPCRADAARMAKLARNGRYTRIPHEAAAEVVEGLMERGWTSHAIASATGVSHNTIARGVSRGSRYSPGICRLILKHGDPTEGSVGATGTRRRLQGLALQRWDLQSIADATGIGFSTVAAIRSGATERVYSRFYTTIRDWTASVEMEIGPSRQARLHAIKKGWIGLLAYDDIDDPNEHPGRGYTHRRRDEVDEVVVRQLMAGERVPSSKAEKEEAMRRWVANGGSRRSFARLHGWRESRYGKGGVAA